jgi:hypothetical protein
MNIACIIKYSFFAWEERGGRLLLVEMSFGQAAMIRP